MSSNPTADVQTAYIDGVEQNYREHNGWLVNWLRGRLGCMSDAEDVAQDTYFRVIRAEVDMQVIQEPRSYLLTIARGISVDLFRRRTVERWYLDALSLLPEQEWPSEEDNAIVLETLIEIDDMLTGLGSKVREVFILSRFGGLKYAQIAEELGISVRTVNNHMARAMESCCLFQLEHDL